MGGTIVVGPTLIAVLKELVAEGQERARIKLSQDMATFVELALWRMAQPQGNIDFDVYLTFHLLKDETSRERLVPKLRNIGDTALIGSGWFERRAKSRRLLRYHIEMGRSAYFQLSHLNKDLDWGTASAQFLRLIKVLQAIPMDSSLDAWSASQLAHGSVEARRLLVRLGMVPGSRRLQ